MTDAKEFTLIIWRYHDVAFGHLKIKPPQGMRPCAKRPHRTVRVQLCQAGHETVDFSRDPVDIISAIPADRNHASLFELATEGVVTDEPDFRHKFPSKRRWVKPNLRLIKMLWVIA